MSAICTRALIVVCLSFSAAAAANPPQPVPRTDLYGDPLPDGAIARLGTVRLRHAGLSDFVFPAGGKTIVSSGSDRMLRSWDVGTGQQTRAVKLQGTAGPGRAVTLSPDGKTLAAHDKGLLVFWEVESGKEIKSLPGPKRNPQYLYFSPDGKTLAVGRSDWRVSFWDWRNGKEREIELAVDPKQARQFGGDGDSTFHGSFSPDGKWFVAGASWQQPLGMFDVATGREVFRLDCNATTSIISPDNKRLAVSSMHGEFGKRETILRLFDLPSGKKIAKFPQGHDLNYYSLAFSPDGKTLCCGASDRGCLVDCATGRVLQKLPDRPWQLAFAPDGKTLAFSAGGRLRLWNVVAGKEQQERPGNFGFIPVTTISPDGRFLASADWLDQAISLWNTTDGRLLSQFPLKGKDDGDRYIRNLAFSPDGRTLVSGQLYGSLRFWDLASGKEQRTVQLRDPKRQKPDDAYFYQLHVSGDGRHVSTLERMLVPAESTRLAWWDAKTGKLLRQETFPGQIREGAWSADGKTVALPIDNVLKLLEVNTGAVRFQIPAVSSGVVIASVDDRLLVAPRKTAVKEDDDISVSVWESITGKEIATMNVGSLVHLALASDNRSLVTTDREFLKVWELATGKECRRWPLPISGIDSWGRTFVSSLLLSRDGQRAFTILADGTALVWDLASTPTAEPLVKKITDKEIAAWWADLIDKDAARAYAAVWRLAEAPEAMVVGFLRTQLKPAAEVDIKRFRQLIADLDSDAFKVRESAHRQLADMGNAAVPALREALAKNPTAEVQRRLETLLSRPQSLVNSPEILRRLRAIQVLERLDSRESRRLLAELAKGMSHADETVEAQRSLARLSRRTASP